MPHPHRCGTACIVSPDMLQALAARGKRRAQREAAARTLNLTASLAQQRLRLQQERATAGSAKGPAPVDGDVGTRARAAKLARSVYDARHREETGGLRKPVRAEGDVPTGDPEIDEAYDGFGVTYAFLQSQFQRTGIDGQRGALRGVVHYGKGYDNAFWDGREMVFGDGDGELFNRFTVSLDVIVHELTHGVTEHVVDGGLDYFDQSGALNECVSDTFGAVARQQHLGLAAADPDGWLIGKGLLAPGVQGRALRDMLNPGTAYDDDQLGKDGQPGTMAGYVQTRSDNGGVHTNSGIPNHAHALAAINLGDSLKLAQIVYRTLEHPDVTRRCDFATWSRTQVAVAADLYGEDGRKAVAEAWREVGIDLAQAVAAPGVA